MKKLICLLALCLCLNGAAALAEEAEMPAEAVSAEATATPEPTEVPPEPTPAPTEVPPEATPAPTEVPPEAAPAPTEVPPEATPEPTEIPPEATPEPTEIPPEVTPAPTEVPAEPTPAPTEVPPEATELPEDAEAWFERDGARLGGRLQDVVPLLAGEEKLYIRAKKPVLVKDAPVRPLSGVTLLADREVFPGEWIVKVSPNDPAAVEQPALADLKALAQADPEGKADLYFWVEALAQTTPEPTLEPTPEPAALVVVASNYVGAEWASEVPEFTLSGIPEGADWSYSAIIYDERIIPMSGDVYAPMDEGVYTVRFAMMNELGDIVDASERYTLWLDLTPPDTLIIEQDTTRDYALSIAAEDGVSGITGLSLDGGATWTDYDGADVYSYVGKKGEVIPPGGIVVRDAAGNTAENGFEIPLEKAPKEDYGGGGGSGGDDKKKAAKTHAKGDGEDTALYDGLLLELPEEPMRELTLGGEVMPLTLVLGAAQKAGAPVGQAQPFTAALERWSAPEDGGEDGSEDLPPDTLVLNAQLDANLGDAFTYEWRFNGEVYRLLANSGIKYVALRVGDDVAAFPTEGFTGGTKYTELRMLGVSTRKFDYTLAMKVNLDPGYVSAMSDSDYSRECDLSIRAEVENMAYELSSSTNSIMYFYNVFLGPQDMLKQPFGAYQAER